jgi:hypothetical protein
MWRHKQADIHQSLKDLAQATLIFLKLRSREIPLQADSLRGFRKERILEGFESLARVALGLTRQDYEKGNIPWTNPGFKSGIERYCLGRMRDAFTHYGPGKWPNIAVRCAMAVILQHLGLEDHSPVHVVAERLRKRLTRDPISWDKRVQELVSVFQPSRQWPDKAPYIFTPP